MYILIDREKCCFVHLHNDMHALILLSRIELVHTRSYILPIDDLAVCMDLTDLEMKLLYRNTTGEDYSGASRKHLNKLVYEAALELPYSDVSMVEIERQSDSIADSDVGFYRYVKGSNTPARLQELFEQEPLTIHTPHKCAKPAKNTHTSAPKPTANPAPSNAANGGAKGAIWGHADELLASGDLTISQARAQAQIDLKETFNRNTLTNTLRRWEQSRLNA